MTSGVVRSRSHGVSGACRGCGGQGPFKLQSDVSVKSLWHRGLLWSVFGVLVRCASVVVCVEDGRTGAPDDVTFC